MSEYYAVVRSGEDDHLEHLFGFGKKKGSTKKNHKYIARVQVGSGWRYFYSASELMAYKAGKAAKGVAGAVSSGVNAVDKKLGVGALIRKKKTGKNLKDSFLNQGKNVAAATAMIKNDPNYKPGGDYEKKWAATLAKDKRKTQRAYKEYDSASKNFNNTVLGKISNSGVGKAVGYSVKRAANKVGETAKKAAHDLKWDTYDYKDLKSSGDGKYTLTKAKLYRKRNQLAKLLGLPALSGYKVDYNTVTTATGKSDDGVHYQWSNRPHARKQKIESGTASIKKKKKVKR